MAWSQNQQIALAIVPKVSSLFSLFGSVWVMLEVLTDNSSNPKRKHPYHRLLLGMSVYDILESVWNFASTWAIPEGTEGVWDPRGTRATCTAQGFFLTLSVAVPIYNAFLSLYYVLVSSTSSLHALRPFFARQTLTLLLFAPGYLLRYPRCKDCTTDRAIHALDCFLVGVLHCNLLGEHGSI
jgi:hypothetical protein